MKKLVALTLCLAIILSFAACEKKQAPSSSAPSSSSQKPSSSEKPSSSKKPSSLENSSSMPSADKNSSLLSSSVVGPTTSNGTEGPSTEVISPSVTPPKPVLPKNYMAYDYLSKSQKEYYDNMLTGIQDMQTGWIVLGESTKKYRADIALVRNALLADHPEIFWLPSYYATAEATSPEGLKTAVVYFAKDAESPPSYLYSVAQKERMEGELAEAVKDIVASVNKKDAYDIEHELHDILCKTAEYSDDEADPDIYSAYGALVNKKALCEGYSKAMQLLLKSFSIPAVVVTGEADGENHMWNMVYIKEEWYNLDVTWNDMAERISHEYFNLSDEMISEDHTFHPDFSLLDESILASGQTSFNMGKPVSKGTEYNYFNHTGFVFSPDGVFALADYLAHTEGDFIEVRFSDKEFRDRVLLDSDSVIQQVNEALAQKHPKCGFTVGGYSISSMVLRIYKKLTV